MSNNLKVREFNKLLEEFENQISELCCAEFDEVHPLDEDQRDGYRREINSLKNKLKKLYKLEVNS